MSYQYAVKQTPSGPRVCDQNLLLSTTVNQFKYSVGPVTLKALRRLYAYAPTNDEYYLSLPAYLKKHPEETATLAPLRKAYGHRNLMLFDMDDESVYHAELAQLVDFFEHAHPNQILAEQPIDVILSYSRNYAIGRDRLTKTGSALDTADELTKVGLYSLCRLLTELSAAVILQHYYDEQPDYAAELLRQFRDKELLLFALLDTDRNCLALLQASKLPNTPDVGVLELPADKRKFAWYVVDECVYTEPERRAERQLFMDEIAQRVPVALDYLSGSLGMRIALKDFCRARGGRFVAISKEPSDPVAVFSDVRARGVDFVLPPAYTEARFDVLKLTASEKVLLPKIVVDDADFDMCKSVSFPTCKANRFRINGGHFRDRYMTSSLRGDVVAEWFEAEDVRFNNNRIEANTMILRNPDNLLFMSKDGERRVFARDLRLTLANQPSLAGWHMPGVYDLLLETTDESAVVFADLNRQFPNLTSLSLNCSLLGEPFEVDSVTILLNPDMSVPRIQCKTALLTVNGTYRSPLETKTLRLRAMPLDDDRPYQITVPESVDLMYSGSERLLDSREFAEAVLIAPENPTDWIGTELRAPHIYFVCDFTADDPKTVARLIQQFDGVVHLILMPGSKLPELSQVPSKVRYHLLPGVTGFNLADWPTFHALRAALRPANDGKGEPVVETDPA